jgi:hypothetical protein
MFKVYAAIAVAVAAMIATVAIGQAVPQSAEGQGNGFGAMKRWEIPSEALPPPYAAQIYDDGQSEWVPIVFFKVPSEIPGGVNLLGVDGLGTGQPGHGPATSLIEGFGLFEASWDPSQGPSVPLLAVLHNPVGQTIPVWFVSRQDYEPVPASVTIGDLLAMPSLIQAEADQFSFVGNPGHFQPTLKTHASGVMPDSRVFTLSLLFDRNTQSFTYFALNFGGQAQ